MEIKGEGKHKVSENKMSNKKKAKKTSMHSFWCLTFTPFRKLIKEFVQKEASKKSTRVLKKKCRNLFSWLKSLPFHFKPPPHHWSPQTKLLLKQCTDKLISLYPNSIMIC
jgi:hypothetical protein